MIIIEQSDYHETFDSKHKGSRICTIGQLLWIIDLHDNQKVNDRFYDIHDKSFWSCKDQRCFQERHRMNEIIKKISLETLPGEPLTEEQQKGILASKLPTKEDDSIRLQGMLKNMTYQQYMEAFNNNDKALEELKRFIFLDSKPAVSNRSTEELQDYIQILEKSRNLLSVVIQKKRSELQDIIDDATETEKIEIRKRDKAYIRDTNNDDKPKRASKDPVIRAEEKMLKTMQDMGVKQTKIDEFIIKFRAGTVKSFNEFMMKHANKAELFD